MTGKRQEEILKRFTDRYSLGASSALNDVEKEAIGAVVGANGYTAVAAADQLIEVLGLEAGTWLLDIGAGRGWPGLYLSKRSRCQAPKASAITLSAISAAASGVSRPRASAKDAPAGACPRISRLALSPSTHRSKKETRRQVPASVGTRH